MAPVGVNVTVDDRYRDRFSTVVNRCQTVGLKIKEQLKDIGVVTGSIEPGKLADLERVEGVADVEIERTIQLPPPESDVQ